MQLFKASSLIIAALLFQTSSFAANGVVVKLRSGYENLAQSLQVAKALAGSDLELLADNSKEFPNGNTYVQLNDPKVNKQGLKINFKDVYFSLPEQLDSNTLMELLFKIYAASKLQARSLTVVSPMSAEAIRLTDLDESHPIPVLRMLGIAGAERFCVAGHCEDLNVSKLPALRKVAKGSYISGDLHYDLASKVARILEQPLTSFAELRGTELRNKSVFLFSAMSQPANVSLLEVLAQTYYLRTEKQAAVQLITPYLPYARSDKQEEQLGVAAQGRLVADLIEGLGAQSLAVVRPHAPQSLGFFTIPTFELPGRRPINAFLQSLGIDTVVSPDAGFQKDATKYAEELHLPVVILNKVRSSDGQVRLVAGHGVSELVRGKRVAIVDDETASGETLTFAARYLKEQGAAYVVAVVTHLAGPAPAIRVSQDIDAFAATDTLKLPEGLPSEFSILSVSVDLAEYISGFQSDHAASI